MESKTSGMIWKMAEDAKQRKVDPPPLPRRQPGPSDVSGEVTEKPAPAQLSKEQLHQQRQKCELKRLMKHTHPELRMLDGVVDEELAEVLSSGATAGESGYEGEVFSRRLIFESKALSNTVSGYAPQMHTADRRADGGVCQTSAVSGGREKTPCNQSVKGIVQDYTTDPVRGCEEEEMIRIDVQASRRIFESQCVKTPKPNPNNNVQRKAATLEDGGGQQQKQKLESAMHGKENVPSESKSLSGQPRKQGTEVQIKSPNVDKFDSDDDAFDEDPATHSGEGTLEEMIKTSAALFKNNPFVSMNVDQANSYGNPPKSQIPAEDSLTTNVKDRTHLFESMPFDKIRRQNKDEVETMVENIKETLGSLYRVKAIHSHGAIIEVNETMIAKKAKFTLSEIGPEINYDEVAEGGAQNFIVQLLPRANQRPQITYLKEDSKGRMNVKVVNVPVQHQFMSGRDAEFKTANVVQLVEDILNQDNSLRKGVIIQEGADSYAKVIVYSLYYYVDEEDVKSYSLPQKKVSEHKEREIPVSNAGNQGLRQGLVESTISSLLETSKDQTCIGSIKPEGTVKGNVKLFKSCIDKGDLEYLKTLQAEPIEQEEELVPEVSEQSPQLHSAQGGDQEEENSSDWVPVDVKRLKGLFSIDQTQKTTTRKISLPSKGIPHNAPTRKTQSFEEPNLGIRTPNDGLKLSGPAQENICNLTAVAQESCLSAEGQVEDGVHQAELAEVVDDSDEMSNLQTAIHSLQQATMEAKSTYDSSQTKQKGPERELTQKPTISQGEVKDSGLAAELQENKDQKRKEEPDNEGRIPGQKQTSETSSNDESTGSKLEAQQQEDDEVVFQGKLQQALDSLGRSNINVTRGDFKAAMIYRNSSRPHNAHQMQKATVQQPGKTEEPSPVTESNQVQLRQESPKDQVTVSCSNNPVASDVKGKKRRSVGPKPAIPPKPEHLKVKQTPHQPSHKGGLQSTQISPGGPEIHEHSREGTVAQPLRKLSSCKDESVSKTNSGAESGSIKGETGQMSQITRQDQGLIQDQVKPDVNHPDESHVDFKEAVQKFGGKKSKNAPVKPKRVKFAQGDNNKQGDTFKDLVLVDQKPKPATDTGTNTSEQTVDCKDLKEADKTQECKVEMREKKGRAETEDERRQRLSVHMDEIMRGNITAAMEIFDNLRKREELQSILSRVEEIEQDTSNVDMTSLRKVFEDVPNWVVAPSKKKKRKKKVEHREEKPPQKDNPQGKSSMAHIFGDLERASEEIMNLKEQTLARLLDIEGAIKKALYSVSTLKSDSDIAGLSCLFKESLQESMQGTIPPENTSKISIGSSRTPTTTPQSNPAKESHTGGQGEVTSVKPGPSSSPAFISIESAVRKSEAKAVPLDTMICPSCQKSPEKEKFCTTKTLTCSSQSKKRNSRKGGQKQAANTPLTPNREVSVLQVPTDHVGQGITGTKTVTENYEKKDNLGNRFYSSTISTVVTTQPETTASVTGPTVVSPNTYQVTTYPEVRLPINHKP